MCCITLNYFPLRFIKSFVLLFSLGLLVGRFKFIHLGMCRFLSILGDQSQKDAYLAQLWKLPATKPEWHVVLLGHFIGMFNDIPFYPRDTSSIKGQALYHNMPCKNLILNLNIVWVADIHSFFNVLLIGDIVPRCWILRVWGCHRLLFRTGFRVLVSI